MTRVGANGVESSKWYHRSFERMIKIMLVRERRLIYEERKKNEREIKIPPFWFRLNAKEISF